MNKKKKEQPSALLAGESESLRSLILSVESSIDDDPKSYSDESSEVVLKEELEKKSIGDYTLETLLGSGGMGEVYLASKEGITNKLAVKILKSNLLPDESCRNRFEQEAKACSMLTSPHLVSVLGYGIASKGEPYIVMNYIEGESLAARLSREKYLDIALFGNIFAQVCDALIHSHTKSIVHRDLKPSNIMLTDLESGGCLVRVVDFGIARILPRAETDEQKLTQTGELLGSPIYMSPEQCTGQPMDARSDIYSLGCVMYESLTGRPPFLGDNVVQTILKHLNETPAKFDEIINHNIIDPELEAVIQKCLAKKPTERYQNVGELKEALEAVDQNTSDARKRLLKSKHKKNKITKFVRRYQLPFFAGTGSILVGITALFAFVQHNMLEEKYQKTVDMAQLADAGVTYSIKDNFDQREKIALLWKEAIKLGEQLNKPAKSMAVLHEKLADDLCRQYEMSEAKRKTGPEQEYEKAISIYETTSGSTSALRKVLEKLYSRLTETPSQHSFDFDNLNLFGFCGPNLYILETNEERNSSISRLSIDEEALRKSKNLVPTILEFEKNYKNKNTSEHDWALYALACHKLAIQNIDRNPDLAIKYLQHAVASDCEAPTKLFCSMKLDDAIARTHMNPNSAADRMKLALRAAANNDLESAILECTVALAIDENDEYKKQLISWRKQLDFDQHCAGKQRVAPVLERLIAMMKDERVRKSSRISAEEALKELAIAYVAAGNAKGVSTTLSKLNQETSSDLDSNRNARWQLNLWCGNVAKAKELLESWQKSLNSNGSAPIERQNMHFRMAKFFVLCRDYNRADQEIDEAFKIVVPGADSFDSFGTGGFLTETDSPDLQ